MPTVKRKMGGDGTGLAIVADVNDANTPTAWEVQSVSWVNPANEWWSATIIQPGKKDVTVDSTQVPQNGSSPVPSGYFVTPDTQPKGTYDPNAALFSLVTRM